MTYLYYSLLFAGLYCYLGLGLTWLIAPPALTRYGLLLAPLVGYCYMTLVGWYCLVGGLRGTDTYAPALCLPPLGFLLIALVRHRRSPEALASPFNKDAAIACGLALMAFIAISVPSMLSPHGLTAMSLGNADLIHTSAAARYLKGFSACEKVGFLGQASTITMGAHDRFGTVLATALPSSLFSLETYQLPNVLVHVFFAFGVLSMVYVAGREVFGYTPFAAAVGVVLTACNPLLYYTTYQIFQAQIIATGLALGLVVLHVQAARAASLRSCLRYLPLAALMTWGLSLAYGHMALFVFAAIGVPVFFLAWQRRSHIVASRWVGFCLATILVTLMCSPERGRLVAKQLFYFGGRVARGETPGWPVPWLIPAGLFTMPDAFPWSGPSVAAPVAWTLGAVFVLLMAWAFGSTYRTDRERFSLMAACSVVVLAGSTALAIADRSATQGYASYKWLSFFLPLILLCLVAPLATGERSRLRPAWWSCLGLLVMGSTFYSAREVVLMIRTPWVVRPELAALQTIEANPKVDSINILGERDDSWDMMWKANFLTAKKLYPEKRTYWQAAPLVGHWDLQSVKPDHFNAEDDILRVNVPGNERDEVIEVSAGHVLTKSYLNVKYGLGWHDREPTLRWTGNGWASGVLFLRPNGGPLPVSLEATYWPLNPLNRLSILLNHEIIARCPAEGSCVVPRVDLKAGENVLEFRSSLPPERPDHGDSRTLGYAFSKIEIDPIR